MPRDAARRRPNQLFGEAARHFLRQHAGQADVPRPPDGVTVVCEGHEIGGGRRQIRPGGETAAHDFEQVGQDGAAGRGTACPGTLQRDATYRVRVDLQPIEHTVGAAEGRCDRYGAGHHGAGQPKGGLGRARRAGRGNEPDGQVQRHRPGDVGGRDARDAGLPVAAQRGRAGDDRIDRGPRTKGEASQDRELVGGVETLHVGTRVALGVALGLRRGKHLLVGASGLHHLGQDEVRAAVDDASHTADVVGRQAARDRIQHGRAAADRGFITERRSGLAGDRLQFQAVMGEHVLVRGHDRLPGAERLGDERAGRLVSAQHLRDHIHVVAANYGSGVRNDDFARHAAVHGTLNVQIGDGHQLEHPAAGGADAAVRVAKEAPCHFRADGARAEDRDTDGSLLGGHRRSTGASDSDLEPQPT